MVWARQGGSDPGQVLQEDDLAGRVQRCLPLPAAAAALLTVPSFHRAVALAPVAVGLRRDVLWYFNGS